MSDPTTTAGADPVEVVDAELVDEPAGGAPASGRTVEEAVVVDAEISGAGPLSAAAAAADDLSDLEAHIEDDLAVLARERDEYLDALRRLQADFENFRKRKQKEAEEQGERAVLDLVMNLLPVLDAGDLAKAHGADESVQQVTGALYDTLAKAGLEGIDPAEGDAFDPNEHEAVMHEPADDGAAEPVVSGVMRAGYRWRGRVVRAAMVKVKG